MESAGREPPSGAQQAPPEGGSRDPTEGEGEDTVEQYMSRSPVCLDRSMTLLEAATVLVRHGISGAPVVERYEGDTYGSGKLVGVLSEEDLLWKEVDASEQSLSDTFREPYLWSLVAADALLMEAVETQALRVLSNSVALSMSEACISVGPRTAMREAAAVMLDAKVKRLPVVAPREGGRPGSTVVGVVSRTDMLRHVLGILQRQAGTGVEGAQAASGLGQAAV